MKKILNFVIILGILLLVFQFGINLFKTNHKADYDINIDSKSANIHEEYLKDKKSDYYFFEVAYGDNKFVFDVDNIFNKQKKVISDIKTYKKGDLVCISPVYIKDTESDIYCDINGVQYDYSNIKDNYNLDEFTATLNKFDNNKYVSSNKNSSISSMDVYKENMSDDENIIVYKYKNLVKLTKPGSSRIQFSNYDVYHNDLGVLVDKYYVMPKYENKPEYTGFLIIDILDDDTSTMYFDDSISTNIYINGIVENKLYIFDKSNMVQYEIDPKKKSYRVTGNGSTGAQYYDGEWSTKNIYEFTKTEIKFNNKISIKDNYVNIYDGNKYYFYSNSNNEYYKVYKKDPDKKVFLFKNSNAKEVKVVNDNLYFIEGNNLYKYDNYSVKLILTNKEFQYNYNNIYSVYFK